MNAKNAFKWDNASPSGMLLTFAMWLGEQAMGSESWISSVPWGWLSLICLAFWMGQDVYHSEGRLRHLWRRIASIVDFEGVTLESGKNPLSENDEKPNDVVNVTLNARARVSGTISRISLRTFSYDFSNNILKGHPIERTFEVYKEKCVAKGEPVLIPIATIPKDFKTPGTYKCDPNDELLLAENTAHYIIVTVQSKMRTQTKELLLKLPIGNTNISINERARGCGNRFLIIDKDESLFPSNSGEGKRGSR